MAVENEQPQKKNKKSKEPQKPKDTKQPSEKALEKAKKAKQKQIEQMNKEQNAFLTTLAEYISTGTAEAEKCDAADLRCRLIVGAGTVITIGGTIGTIAFSLDFIPTFVTAIITIIGAASIFIGFYLYHKAFGADWGLMLKMTNERKCRICPSSTYSDFRIIDPKTKQLIRTYEYVEKAHIIPGMNRVVLRCFVPDKDTFFNKDAKFTYVVHLNLNEMNYLYNGSVEIKEPRIVEQPEIVSFQEADPDEPEDYDGDNGITDADYKAAMK